MTKSRSSVADAPQADVPPVDAPQPPTEAPNAAPVDQAEIVEVKFIGPERAILGGSYILHNESRRTSRAIVASAEKRHPGEFVILSGI